MTNKKSMKRALISSLLIMAMCFSMLVGTTFAWFTDSVTSAGNVIKSGTLDIEFQWANGTEVVADADWQDASQGAIFDYDLWEPGYVEVRHIRIANVGSLALKYSVHIAANDEVTDLADVIDVYYIDPAVQVADRAALDTVQPIGSLSQALAGMSDTATGALAPKGAESDTLKNSSETITIALKMREEAGNEYQNKSIGSSFSIQLLATQYTYESDSFDEMYDDDAELPAVRTVTTAKVENGAANFTANDAPVDNKTTTVAITNVNADADDTLTLSVATEGLEAAKSNFTVEENHTAVAGIDLTLEKNGTKVPFENGSATVTTYILPGLDPANVKVKYNGTGDGGDPTSCSYNPTTGELTFTTTHFSEFYADYEGEFAYLEATGRAYTGDDPASVFLTAMQEYIASKISNVDKIKVSELQDAYDDYIGFGPYTEAWTIQQFLLDGWQTRPTYVENWKMGYVVEGFDAADLLAMEQEYFDIFEECINSVKFYPVGDGVSGWAPYPMGWGEPLEF